MCCLFSSNSSIDPGCFRCQFHHFVQLLLRFSFLFHGGLDAHGEVLAMKLGLCHDGATFFYLAMICRDPLISQIRQGKIKTKMAS